MPKQSGSGVLSGPFKLIWIFYFLSFVAGFQLFPVLPMHLRALGATLAESGRFQAAFWMGSGLGCLFTGPLGDRLGQRRVLVAASFLFALFFVAYAAMPTRWGFYLLAPLHGVVWSALRTAAMAWIGGYLSPEQRAQGISLFGMAAPAGIAVGPLVGVWLYPHLGFTTLTAGFAVLLAALAVLITRLPKVGVSVAAGGGFRLPEPWVLLPAAVVFMLGFGDGPMAPYSAQEAKALHLFWPSAYLTCFALGMVGIRLLLGLMGMPRNLGRLVLAMLALALAGNLMLALLPGDQLRHVIAGLCYGAGFAMTQTLMFTYVVTRSAPDRRGAGIGALYFFFDTSVALGSYAVGLVMGQAGFRMGWTCGALVLIPALFLALKLFVPETQARPA
jgi:MFS family permease